MSILVDSGTRLLVQGMGRVGQLHARLSLEFGTQVVGGVTPGRGGGKAVGVPVFNTVREAVRETGANASVVFVPPAGATDAILEATEAGIPLVVAITEGIPVRDILRVQSALRGSDTRLLGPNCPGLLSPAEQVRIGIAPASIFRPGSAEHVKDALGVQRYVHRILEALVPVGIKPYGMAITKRCCCGQSDHLGDSNCQPSAVGYWLKVSDKTDIV